MSEENQTQEQQADVQEQPKANETVQQPSKHERRQDRREERARQQPKSENAAPSNLFKKAAGSDVQANPERVKIIKLHIAEYAKTCTIAQGDNRDTLLAFNGLTSAVRNMFTLNGTELGYVFESFLKAIKEDQGGAFTMGILYRYISQIKDLQERETFIAVMDLLTSYARLQDPSKIRALKDVDFAVRYVRNQAAAKAFTSLFPSK